MPEISVVLAGISLFSIFIWYRSRGTGRRLKKLEAELASLTRRRRSSERISQYLGKVYSLLQQGITAKDTKVCYQAVEILKGAYGNGISRPDELSNLVGLCVMALREKQLDVAGILVDAARLIVKRQPDSQSEQSLAQLQLLATVALREKQNFIASKTVELIFYTLDRAGNDLAVASRALAALRAVGVLVIRRRDSYMLRETIATLSEWYRKADPAVDNAISEMAAAWLHRSLYSSEPDAFDIINEFITEIAQFRRFGTEALYRLTAELKNMAGTLSLDPGNRLLPRLITMIIELGFAQGNIEHSRQAVKAVGEVARMSVHNHDWLTAFPVLYPLLEQGRKMLTIELKFGGEASDGGYRQHTLFFIIKEYLAVIEYAARRKMTANVAELTDEYLQLWQERSETVHTLKSFKKFCGLLLLYYASSRRQKTSASQQANHLALFTDGERERLKVFIGGIQHELLSGAGPKV